MREPIATQGLLPHGGAMHLIDEVIRLDKTRIEGDVTARLEAEGPYFGKFGFEDHWLIELCAQASAAIYLLARRELHPQPPRGYLVSVREFQVFEPAILRADDKIDIHVHFEVEATPLGQSRCQVKRADLVIAEGEMSFLLETEG